MGRFPKWKRALALFTVIATIKPSVNAKRNRYIVPGAPWYDTGGNVLSAHAGGIVEHDGKWYWFGQNERAEDKDLFSGINVYSSPDLLNWDFEGKALSSINGTVIGPDTVVERPKAVFNQETQTWVLWFHSDNSTYGLLRQGVATSPNITGPYAFQEVFSPLGGTSQDFGLFHDVDHDASYALYSNGDADAAHDNLISRMNSTFTGVEEVVYEFPDFDLEAPTMFFSGSRYYILMSHKTGYRPNNVVVFSAEKLAGPWSAQSYIATLGTRTFNSQSTMIISVKGSDQSTFLYCGDQWTTAKDLYLSTYVWLPMKFNDDTGALHVEWHDLYSIDVKTGSITVPQGTSYEAEHGEVTGLAYTTLCVIQGNGTLTISNIEGTGQPQWVSIYYHNPDGKCMLE
ncbi:Arabinanase/levansucrase/invertase [Dendrothele bispora CBS 962.96]|uniref:Arabinanase/levansucrase/invertase n=1 Tax=Dendrothele bispora (strain CBS 962.96) TaxID=1314807 RepID=A0A4S8MN25_DENBC|nr:Arabinanase/levansucrase/invertase [Dendrothele bispora CBS 962.96]